MHFTQIGLPPDGEKEKANGRSGSIFPLFRSPPSARLNAAFDRLAEDPFHHYNIKPLSGELEGSYRLRIGNIRIIYSVDDTVKIVFIEVIGFRGDVYK